MIVWGLTNISQLWDWIEGGHHLSKGFLSPQIIVVQHCQKPQSNASSYIAENHHCHFSCFVNMKNALSLTSFSALQEHNWEMSSKSSSHDHHHDLLHHHQTWQDLHNAMKMLGLNPMEQEIIDLTNNISRNIWQYIWFQYWFTNNQSTNNNICSEVDVWCHKHDYHQEYQHHYYYDRNIFININVWCQKQKPWNNSGMVSIYSIYSIISMFGVTKQNHEIIQEWFHLLPGVLQVLCTQ